MRPARPGNDPYRRDDDPRDRRANPPEGRDRDGYAPPPGSYEPDDPRAASRDVPPRRTRRADPRDQEAGVYDDVPQDRYRQSRPVNNRSSERGPTGESDRSRDPYRSRQQGRDARPLEPRIDRSRAGRPRDDRPDAYAPDPYAPAGLPPRQRYGAITPSDELAWPDPEPTDADWQPVDPRGRRGSGRGSSASPRRDDSAPRPSYREPRGDRFGAAPTPSGPPAWSTFEPNQRPIADDDLSYDVYPEGYSEDYPVDRTDRRGAAGETSGNWPGSRPTRDRDELDEVDGDWHQAEDDPANGWTDADGADDEPAESALAEPLPADDPRAMVFSAPERPTRRASGHGEGIRPPVWGLSGYAWRFARRLTIPRTNRLLRFGASRVLPASTQARFEAMGLPATEVDETLRQVRSLDDWAEAWTGTAQRFLGETRRGGDMTPTDAARSRQLAALCYHVASFFAFGDDRLARTSRSAATTLFGQSLGLLMPETRQVNVRWRSKTMPGYLTVPSWATGRRPLAVLLNGTTTSREELVLWADEFLAQGIAVLALDTPGFGEGVALGPVSLDNDDILDGILELAEADPGLDPTKISLVGVSLGGTLAFRAAAGDRRVSAIVAVTPTYEPARWLGASSQVALAQMVPLFGGYDQLADFVLGLDMPGTLAATQAQALVFGAGRDLVVPPPEASRLAADLGEQATLVWFDDAGHALFDAVPEWTREAAEWLAVVMEVADAPIFMEPAEDDQLDETPSDEYLLDDGEHGDRPSRMEASPADVTEADDRTGFRPDDDPDQTEPGSGQRQPLLGRGASRSAGQGELWLSQTQPRTQEPASSPEPYGADVFDASEGPDRRSEQQRGYETGVFGPLGPAAARILADDPTPQPGSAEWGYEDGNRWSDDQQHGAPWDDPNARHAPSTERLWQSQEPAGRPAPAVRPTIAGQGRSAPPADEPAVTDRPTMSSPAEPLPDRESDSESTGSESDAIDRPVAETPSMARPSNPTPDTGAVQSPSTGDYLAPGSPSVGRGRTSERFRVVSADTGSPSDAVLGEPQPVDRETAADNPSRTAPVDSEMSGAAGARDPAETAPKPADETEPSPDTDLHAPFRPPPSQTD